MEPIQAGILSILPPVIAIALALITKEVFSSLIIGILSGTLIYSFSTGSGIVSAISSMFTIMGNEFSATMIIFLALLGALVAVITMAGGSNAYGEWASKKIKSREGAQLATCALGALIFIDDYFNCLTVGTVMKPVTDKNNISRAKLAYLIDATAAPVCIIAPISSWAASVISNFPETENMSGMQAFISSVPFNLYAILTILMIVVLSVTKLDFGPMARFEKNAMENNDLFSNEGGAGASDELAGVPVSNKGRVFDLVIPIVSLIIFTVLCMLYTGDFFDGGVSLFEGFGNCDANLSLAMGGFGALVVAILLFVPRKILSFRQFMDGVVTGVKSMVSACMILTLAWTIKGVCTILSTDVFVSQLVADSNLIVGFIPVIIFIVAAFLSFSTGTAWGTFGILIPIITATCQKVAPELLIITLSATLAGSVFGDHCSPISDTTILSSTGAGCNHIDHVSTQIPYAITVAICCAIGYIVAGFTRNVFLTLGTAIILLIVALTVLHRITVGKDSKKA